jgi:AcrR family transcriptional regulator
MITKHRILAAAQERFHRDGIAGLSMRSLAKDVGLTPMALYRHYADKEALIDALSAAALDDWRDRLAAIEAPSAFASLEAVGEAFLDFALEAPRRFEAAFLLPARGARRFPDDIVAGRSPPLNLVMAHIEQAQRDGTLGAAPPSEIAMTIWALSQGLVALYRANRFSDREAFRTTYRAALRRCYASFSQPGTLP